MRATRALIHLENLRMNIRTLKKRIGPAVRICMAVKADAYGHGSIPIVRTALQEGVGSFGVATIEEAAELRSAGITAPVILFSLTTPEEFPAIAEYGLEPFVADMRTLKAVGLEAAKVKRKIGVHIKIETGMGRIGCSPDDAFELCTIAENSPWLTLAGICTHFPGADEEDPSFTRNQLEIFRKTITGIRERGIRSGLVHAANSAAALRFQDTSFDMIRPGIVLYGYPPGNSGLSAGDEQTAQPFLPVMELESSLVFLKRVEAGIAVSYGMTYRSERETIIATVPLGYADGFNRSLSNRGSVFLNGKAYPVAGRVCMDQFMVDLGPENPAERYDRVTIFGPDPAGPNAQTLAELCGTIPYEITCGISRRVPRVYTDENS